MGKILFLSNGTKPTDEEYNSKGEERLTRFSIPSVKAAMEMGMGITIGINRRHAAEVKCAYPVSFYNAEIYRNPFCLKEVYRAYQNAVMELRKGEYDAIHCNTPIGGLVGRLAGKKCKISKVIYTVHGFHFYKGAPKKNWLLYYPVEKWLARYTDALITINHEDYTLAQKKMKLRRGGKVYYVPGVGIDLDQFGKTPVDRCAKRQKLGIPEEAPLLLSAGELNPNKNHETVIRAIAGREDIYYIIAGRGELQEHLQKVINELGMTKRVKLLGYRTDVSELYGTADIFVFPSFREGLARSVMEAMASGLPCVVSDIRGNTDLIDNEKGGYLCRTTDPAAFAEAIGKLADEAELREEMSRYNLEKVRAFDVSIVERKIQEIYDEVLAETHAVLR